MTKITKTGDGRFETNHFKYHPRTMWARGNEVVLVPYGFADDVCEYYGGDVQEFMLVREGANDGGGAFLRYNRQSSHNRQTVRLARCCVKCY